MSIWTKDTYERLKERYKPVIDQYRELDLDFNIKELMIRMEFLKRDFSKRQQNIMVYIFSLSFYFGKDEALIPYLSDFSQCGVAGSKAKAELEKLEEMDVISWDREKCLYRIKDPILWKAPHHYGYNDKRAQEVLMLNLRHVGIDTESIVAKEKQQ